jgi:hypothetical protein
VNIFLFIVFLVRHSRSIYNLKFQSLYLRLSYLIPVISILSLLGIIYTEMEHYKEVIVSFLEGVILITFLGVIIGRAWESKKDLYEVLWTTPTHFFCCTISYHWCCCFLTKENVLGRVSANVSQFMIVKPVLEIIKSATAQYKLLAVDMLLRVLGVAATVTAVLSILTATLILQSGGCFRTDMAALKKFVTIKAFFVLLVLNSLLLKPILLYAVPYFACPILHEETHTEFLEECSVRTMQFAVLVETFIYTVFLSSSFKPEFKDEKYDPAEAVRTGYGPVHFCGTNITSPVALLFYYSFRFTDIYSFIFQKPVRQGDVEIAPILGSTAASPDIKGQRESAVFIK